MPNTKKKIAIASLWPLSANMLERIRQTAPGYELLDLSEKPSDTELAQCEIIFGNPQPELFSKMPNLKWMHAQTAGVEWYLGPGGLRENVVLTNSSGAYGISIAEHMLTVTLMLLRNARAYIDGQYKKEWESAITARNIYDCHVAVIGLGDIGGRYAQLCHGMGAVVSGVVRSPRAGIPPYVNEIFTVSQIEDAIKTADVVALALPGTDETVNILSKERLSKMKKGALVTNVGRGSAIDQDALIELLQSGHLGGAALDVTTPEPLPEDNPLWEMPNVIITPHISHGGRDNTAGLVIDKFLWYLDDYLAGRPFERVVDRVAGY